MVLHEVLGRCKGTLSFCYSTFNSDHRYQQGLAQPAYQGNNWFTDPPMTNNLAWAQGTITQQFQNNQVAYAANGWPTYPNGAYDPQRDNTTSPPITDWAPGDPTPAWSPIAGGKGWGQPNSVGSENPPASEAGLASSVSSSATPAIANGAIPPPSVTPSGVTTSVSGGQEAGQGGPPATTSMISTPYSNGTAAVPGSVQVVTNEYDEQDECDEL